MAIRTKTKKTAQPTKTTRIDKHELSQAELEQVSGGDGGGSRFGTVI